VRVLSGHHLRIGAHASYDQHAAGGSVAGTHPVPVCALWRAGVTLVLQATPRIAARRRGALSLETLFLMELCLGSPRGTAICAALTPVQHNWG
jgi:hypothetical protein